MIPRIVVLASCGRHPGSGRPRISPHEGRALALAARLGADLEVLHAGQAGACLPVLQDFLGMGATRLTILDIGEGGDPLDALVAALKDRRPDIVLAGTQAEQGECSGYMPYAIAEAIGAELVAAAVDFSLDNGRGIVTQAVSGGRRRKLSVPLPLMLTVDAKGPTPPLVAFGRMRRGTTSVVPAIGDIDTRSNWAARVARPRPKRLSAPGPGGVTAPGKRLLRDLDAEAAAQAIFDYLQQEGVVAPPHRVS